MMRSAGKQEKGAGDAKIRSQADNQQGCRTEHPIFFQSVSVPPLSNICLLEAYTIQPQGGHMQFSIERRIKSDPEKVWKLISDFSLSPGQGVNVRVIEPGGENGVNLVREVTVGTMALTERIDSVEPGTSFWYSIIKGTPTKIYKGKGQVGRSGNETIITWSGDFTPKIPFTGAIIGMIAKKSVAKYLDAVLLKGGMKS